MVPVGGTGEGQGVAPVPMTPEQIQMANFIASVVMNQISAQVDSKLEAVRGEMRTIVDSANEHLRSMSQQHRDLVETRVHGLRTELEPTLMRAAADVAQRVAVQQIAPATQAALDAAQQASQAQNEMRFATERVIIERARVEAAAAQASNAAGVAAAAAGLASTAGPSAGQDARSVSGFEHTTAPSARVGARSGAAPAIHGCGPSARKRGHEFTKDESTCAGIRYGSRDGERAKNGCDRHREVGTIDSII